MKISIITLFPDMFTGPFSSSIVKRAQEKNRVVIEYINIRDYARDRYRTVDDHPYGGGVGMVLKVDILHRALQDVKTRNPKLTSRIILLDPQGSLYTQEKAKELCLGEHLILICGHYEGIDERIREIIDEEISVGDFICTGGEIPAMIVADSVVRLLPGVLNRKEATANESFEHSILEYPHYTRPLEYLGIRVPDVLLSGNHAKIQSWRHNQAEKRTKIRRPDLFKRHIMQKDIREKRDSP